VNDSAGRGQRARRCGWRAVFQRSRPDAFRNAPAFLATQDSFRNRTVALLADAFPDPAGPADALGYRTAASPR